MVTWSTVGHPGLDPITYVATLLLWVCGPQLVLPGYLCTPAGTGHTLVYSLPNFIFDSVPYVGCSFLIVSVFNYCEGLTAKGRERLTANC